MPDLIFKDVKKVFHGGVTAVEGFSLTIPSPTMVVIVGPSGCGKTTLLRIVAGLEKPTSGAIYLGEARLDTLPARERDMAMVFQSYALYPHMTVSQNLSFGLRLRKTPRQEVSARVADVAKTLEIDELLSRRPGELSGGQRQRVALGRAVIRRPRVFLFDEPLSNLDARLRGDMRAMIKKLYNRLKVTSIYVTHDQVEAMTIGEQLVVMKDGRIHQVGPPETCYNEPKDTFVASFLGSPPMNFIDATVAGNGDELSIAGQQVPIPAAAAESLAKSSETDVVVGVRPEDIQPASPGGAVELALRGQVVLVEPLGHEVLTHLTVGNHEVVARGTRPFENDAEGNATLYVDGGHFHLFSKRNGARLAPGWE